MTDLSAPFRAIEAEHRQVLKGRFTVIRIDGKGFSRWTSKLERPYDAAFTDAMTHTARELAQMIPQTLCTYVVSDEISVVVENGDDPASEPWFGGVVSKIVSLSASMATAAFNSCGVREELALFDSRAFSLDEAEQVLAYLDWRRADGVRNAVSSAAHAAFGTKALHNVGHSGRIQMLAEAGRPISDLPDGFVRGRITTREVRSERVAYQDRRTGEWNETEAMRAHWLTEDALGNFSDFTKLRPGD